MPGTAIGILSGDDHRSGNAFLTFAVATGMGEARNAIITRTVDGGVIAIDGEYGTLSEIALAIKMGGKPVVGIGTWKLSGPGGRGVKRSSTVMIRLKPLRYCINY